MQCDHFINVIIVLGRVAVLVLGMLSGMGTIYLGWRLYKDAVISKTSGELNYKSMKIVLTSGGPGVFLAIFGAYILITVLAQKMELQTTDATQEENQISQKLKIDKDHHIWLAEAQADKQANENQMQSPPSTLACKPKREVCAIKSVTIRLLTGSEPLSPLEIRHSLDISIEELNVLEEADTARKYEYRRAINTLIELRKGIVE